MQWLVFFPCSTLKFTFVLENFNMSCIKLIRDIAKLFCFSFTSSSISSSFHPNISLTLSIQFSPLPPFCHPLSSSLSAPTPSHHLGLFISRSCCLFDWSLPLWNFILQLWGHFLSVYPPTIFLISLLFLNCFPHFFIIFQSHFLPFLYLSVPSLPSPFS